MNYNKNQLMKIIYESGLAAYDTVLFLDTHPCNSEALSYYAYMSQLNQNAVREYEEQYGPLTTDWANSGDAWTWVCTPWPWEMGGC